MDIKIDGLSKFYGPQKAVDNISFQVKTGEILGFLGPNGAGKTTTMKIITSFIDGNEGHVSINGQNVEGGQMKKYIGYLPEHNPLYHEMAVMDYLSFCASLQGVSKEKIEDRVIEMIRVCGLDKEKHKRIGELSKGFRQRVGIAQAMIHDPEILILDEPTTGLDPNQIVEIRDLIRKLGQSKTVILSTHILPEVEATCDRILIINNGKIVADGTANSLRKQAQGKEVLQFVIEEGKNINEVFEKLKSIASIDSLDIVNAEEGRFEAQSHKDMSSKRAIFKLCVKENWILTEMLTVETKLEDIFRDLTLN